MLRLYFFILTSLILSSCVTDDGSVVSTLHPRPELNSDYREVIEAHTKSKHVRRIFETVYHLHVTFLTPEVLSTFEDKFENLFHRPQELIEKNKIAFFVSVFAPNSKEADVSNKHEWFTNIQIGLKNHPPEKVVRLKKSKLWSNFFPYVTSYSREFILYFNPKDLKSLKENEDKILTLSNSQAKTVIHW